MDDIIIDPEFSAIFEPLDPEAMQGLQKKMLSERFRDPIVVWDEENILLDGHTRLTICKEYKLPYKVERLSFPDRETARDWIIENQDARRNLSAVEKERLRREQRQRVQQARAAGQSVRAIANKEKIDPKQVQRDLTHKQTPVDMSTPDAPDIEDSQKSSKVAGTDGKMYPAKKPGKRCPNCKKAGLSGDDCQACIKLRRGTGQHIGKPDSRRNGTHQAPTVLKDKVGNEVPKRCRDAFADPGLGSLIDEIVVIEAGLEAERWLKRAEKLCDHYPFLLITKFREHAYDALNSLQLARESLAAGVPHAVCPKCQGAGEGVLQGTVCGTCRGSGHVPETRYQELQRESV